MFNFSLLRTSAIFFFGLLALMASCKKEMMIPVQSKQNLHLDEAKKWVDEHPTAQIIGLDWSKGKLLSAHNQSVMRVPVLNEDRMSRIRNSSTKDVLNSVITGSNEPGGNKENDNPNYSPGHPPAVFFVKDSNNQVSGYLLNFVPTDKNKENGSDGIWTGKLYQWNMKGDTLLVLNYEKSKIIDRYLTGPVRNKAEASSFAKLATLKPDNQVGSIWSWLKGILSAVWDALNWMGYHLGIPGAYRSTNPYWWYGGRGDGDGDGNQTTENTLDDSVYPLYLDYGGASHYAPALTDVDVLLIQLGIQDDILAQYLEDDLANGGSIASEMKNFINTNGNSAESIEFVKWGIRYLMDVPSVDFATFKNHFMVSSSVSRPPYKIDEATRRDYPKFAGLVDKIDIFLADNPKVVEALVKYTGFSKEKIFEIATPGKGPYIQLVEDSVAPWGNGFFNAKISNNILFLSKGNIANFENNAFIGNTYQARNALAFSIVVTILHETVHYGRFASGLYDPRVRPDYGDRFEEAGFGFNVQFQINQPINYKLYIIP